MSSLHSLYNIPLSDVSFTNIFSQSVACLLVLLMLSLTEQELLVLMKSSSSITSFMDLIFGTVSKKTSLYSRASRFSPVIF